MGEEITFTGVVRKVENITMSPLAPRNVSATSHSLEQVQWGNLVVASIAGLCIHAYIAFSVLKKRLLHDKYMLLTYMRSYIDVIYLVSTLYVQEVYRMQPNSPMPTVIYGEEFRDAYEGVQHLIINIKRLAQQLQILLLMMMIIHRFLVFTRPGIIPSAYGIFFLVCLVFCCATGVIHKPSAEAYRCIYMVLITILVLMAIVVHSSLKNYFTAHKYSTNVCEMQGKTSKFLLYCILIYSVCYVIFPLISIFSSGLMAAILKSDPQGKVLSAAAMSQIIGDSLVPWLPLADGILTLWSVKGYLSTDNNPIQRGRISVVQSSESHC